MKVNRIPFSANGTNEAEAFIAGQQGRMIVSELWYSSPGAGTLVAYPARARTTAAAAVSNSTTLTVDTDASGKIQGAVLTTSDYVLVKNDSGTGNAWYLESISVVGAVSGSVVSLTLGGAVYCSEDDGVYIIRAADIATYTTADEEVRDWTGAFAGYSQMPMALALTATGTCRFGGTMDVFDPRTRNVD